MRIAIAGKSDKVQSSEQMLGRWTIILCERDSKSYSDRPVQTIASNAVLDGERMLAAAIKADRPSLQADNSGHR